MITALIENDTTKATKSLSGYLCDAMREKFTMNEVYNTADGPHNNWGEPIEDEDEDEMEDEDFYDIEDIPRGDRSIEDLDREGHFDGENSMTDKGQIQFVSQRQADIAMKILQRWGIDANIQGDPYGNGKYNVIYDDPDGSIRAELDDELSDVFDSMQLTQSYD